MICEVFDRQTERQTNIGKRSIFAGECMYVWIDDMCDLVHFWRRYERKNSDLDLWPL